MANARSLRLGPNATYIPLARCLGFCVRCRENFASPNARDTNMLVFFALVTQKYPTRIVLLRSGI